MTFESWSTRKQRLSEDCNLQMEGKEYVDELEGQYDLDDGIDYYVDLIQDFSDDKDFILYFIETFPNLFYDQPHVINNISPRLKDDFEFMLQMAKQDNYLYFHYASDRIREDPQTMLEASSQDVRLATTCTPDLKRNEEFMLQLLQIDGMCIRLASDNLLDDKEFMSNAVKIYPKAYHFASQRLLDDKDFMVLDPRTNIK